MEHEQPQHKETIHGHPVYCDDQDVRMYLKRLDSHEADVIFQYAKHHGRADFEMKKGSTRYNCYLDYNDDGTYAAISEGMQNSGWF